MTPANWIWIPIVLAAAGAQTIRNAAQRSLVESAGTLAATLVRFLYGLPFTLAALGVVAATSPGGLPAPTAPFLAWSSISTAPQDSRGRRLRPQARHGFSILRRCWR